MFTIMTRFEEMKELTQTIIKENEQKIREHLGVPDLNITYQVVENKKKTALGFMQVEYDHYLDGRADNKRYTISVMPKGIMNSLLLASKSQFEAIVMEVLVHELTHVRQDMSKLSHFDYQFDFNGLLPYEARPNEVEARKEGSEYNKHVGNTTFNKEILKRQIGINLVVFGAVTGMVYVTRLKKRKML